MSKFLQANKGLDYMLSNHCLDTTEALLNKHMVQKSYEVWLQMAGDKVFLNWGVWDKKLYNEYLELNFNFSKISDIQDIHSQLLLYLLIRPLIKTKLFNKKLLEIGFGNGLGLKASSELLKTDYALGVDLVSSCVTNATHNYYSQDKVNYIQSDAEKLPLANESFDIVINIESSHLYPRIEDFFSEVERVLAPEGYFCYTDFDLPKKPQSQALDRYIQGSKGLKIIQKVNITKLVQASIYERIFANEEQFYNFALSFLGKDSENFKPEMIVLTFSMGLSFLPWWKIWFKTPELRYLAKAARKSPFWKKKHYFYYLIQKQE